jgi:hypothetical protein
MARIDPKIMLRVSSELKERLQEAAATNNRSLNAELVSRLELSFTHGSEGGESDAQALRDELSALRHSLFDLVQALVAADKDGFARVVEGLVNRPPIDPSTC